MDNTKAHNDLMDDIILEFGSRKNIRIWKRVVGFDKKRKIRYGIPGEPDLEGIIKPYGRMLVVEVKTGKGRLNPKQKIRKVMLKKYGALYIEARSVKQAIYEYDVKMSDYRNRLYIYLQKILNLLQGNPVANGGKGDALSSPN